MRCFKCLVWLMLLWGSSAMAGESETTGTTDATTTTPQPREQGSVDIGTDEDLVDNLRQNNTTLVLQNDIELTEAVTKDENGQDKTSLYSKVGVVIDGTYIVDGQEQKHAIKLAPNGTMWTIDNDNALWDDDSVASLTFKNVTIADSKKPSDHGIFMVKRRGTLDFDGVEVKNITPAATGNPVWGGIVELSNNGRVRIQNSKFENINIEVNNSRFDDSVTGGVIYVQGNERNTDGASVIKYVRGSQFNNNSLTSISTRNAFGGAMYIEGKLEEVVNSKFDGNSVHTTQDGVVAYGGAIAGGGIKAYEYAMRGAAVIGTIGTEKDLTDNEDKETVFANNFVLSEKGDGYGGAIYSSGKIKQFIGAKFNNNYVKAVNAYGGAIASTSFAGETVLGTGDDAGKSVVIDAADIELIRRAEFDGNYVLATNAAKGGAFYNGGHSDIVTGTFKNNYAKGESAQGGAFFNAEGDMRDPENKDNFIDKVARYISGLFEKNYVQGKTATGGGLYNEGIINNIKMIPGYANALNADFVGNYAVAFDENNKEIAGGEAMGGGVYNNGRIDSLTATFEGNSVKGAKAWGGALANTENGIIGKIESTTVKKDENTEETILASFSNNFAISGAGDGEAKGGALFNTGRASKVENERVNDIDEIKADFKKNYVQAANLALGGGVYNNGIIGTMSSTFENNYATGKKALGGALANTKTGIIDHIEESSFMYNSAISASLDADAVAKGGAIYNLEMGSVDKASAGEASDGEEHFDINYLKSDFVGNYASAVNAAYGGAIYNEGKINDILAEFTDNYVKKAKQAYGGAFANVGEKAVIDGINNLASFSGNYIETDGTGYGGAIYNSGKIDEGIDNTTFKENKVTASHAFGGAVYNVSAIGDIKKATFKKNEVAGTSEQVVEAYGGAIVNSGENAVISSISEETKFEENKVAVNGEGFGGAVYNSGKIEKGIKGTSFISNVVDAINALGGAIYNAGVVNEAIDSASKFEGNFATADTQAWGGAIYNEGTLGDVAASFSNNSASGKMTALGGALANVGTIGNISGTFERNTAQGGQALGGAVYAKDGQSPETANGTDANEGKTSSVISANFSGNKAEGSTLAMGGAVWAWSDDVNKPVEFLNANFENNSVSVTDTNGKAYGGAVYGNALKFTANGTDTKFERNTANGENNAIYVAGLESLGLGEDKAAKVEFAALEGGKIFVHDNVDGKNYDMTISGDGKAGSEVWFNGKVDNAINTVLAENAVVHLGKNADFNTESYSANAGSKTNVDGKLTTQKYAAKDASEAEIAGALKTGNYEAAGIASTTITGTLETGAYSALDYAVMNVAEKATLKATTYSIADHSTTNVLGTLSADNYKAAGNSVTTVAENATLGAKTYLAAGYSTTNVEGTLNATDSYQAENGSVTHLIGNINVGDYLANAGSLMHLGQKAAAHVKGNYIGGGTLKLDLSIDGESAENGLITVDGQVSGTTDVIVNMTKDGQLKGFAKFVEAKKDTTGTKDSFKVVDVLGSSYVWESMLNALGNEEGHAWYLAIEGTEPIKPNPGDEEEKPNPGDEEDKPNPGDDPNKPKPDDPIKPNPGEDEDKPNPGEDEDKPNKPNKPNKPVVPSNPVYRAEVAAYTALQTIAVEQNRSIANSVAKGLASKKSTLCYQETCGIAELMPKKEAWIDMTYENAKIDTPAEIDAKISGTTLGIDFYRLGNERAGLFGAYRHGKYDLSGEGRYYAKTGADVTNKSWLGGAYYQYDDTAWKVLGTVFAGTQKMDIKTDDRLAFADTDAKQYGASAEVSKHFELTDEISLSPSLGLYYTTLDIDTIHDNLRKQAKFDTLHYLEAEAGVAVEYVSCHDGNTRRVYVKPSVIKTFASGGKTRMGDINKPLDTFEERTLGRLELGGNFGLNDQWNGYAETGYTFGDDYKAYDFTVGIGYRF